MREYGKVFTAIWSSPSFREMTEDGRTLALYLLTCQHGTITGAFRLPDGYACEDLQWSCERVREGFAELLSKGFANRCETTKWVWIEKFLEWNKPENPNQRKAAARHIDMIPPGCAWKPVFMRVCGPSLGLEPPEYHNPLQTLSEPFLNQEQEQEQEQKSLGTAPRAEEKPLTVRDLVGEGVDESHASDWLKTRKAKKAPLTKTAWDAVRREAESAGLTPAQAVKAAAENGWQGFKASWYAKLLKDSTSPEHSGKFAGVI